MRSAVWQRLVAGVSLISQLTCPLSPFFFFCFFLFCCCFFLLLACHYFKALRRSCDLRQRRFPREEPRPAERRGDADAADVELQVPHGALPGRRGHERRRIGPREESLPGNKVHQTARRPHAGAQPHRAALVRATRTHTRATTWHNALCVFFFFPSVASVRLDSPLRPLSFFSSISVCLPSRARVLAKHLVQHPLREAQPKQDSTRLRRRDGARATDLLGSVRGHHHPEARFPFQTHTRGFLPEIQGRRRGNTCNSQCAVRGWGLCGWSIGRGCAPCATRSPSQLIPHALFCLCFCRAVGPRTRSHHSACSPTRTAGARAPWTTVAPSSPR